MTRSAFAQHAMHGVLREGAAFETDDVMGPLGGKGQFESADSDGGPSERMVPPWDHPETWDSGQDRRPCERGAVESLDGNQRFGDRNGVLTEQGTKARTAGVMTGGQMAAREPKMAPVEVDLARRPEGRPRRKRMR